MKPAEKLWKVNDWEYRGASETDRLVGKGIWTRGEEDAFGLEHIELGC